MDINVQEPNSTNPGSNEFRFVIPESQGGRNRSPSPSPDFDDRPGAADDDADSFSLGDDAQWDVFLPDDDEIDPLPEPGDFWFNDD